MENKIDPAKAYKTLVIIWFALLISQVLLFGLIYISVDEVFPIDFSKPILGDKTLFVVLAAFLALDALLFSFYRRSKLLKLSVKEQKIEIVQEALITSVALAESITLLGVFLAFASHYQYFFIWIIVGVLATILLFPRRSHVNNASVVVI